MINAKKKKKESDRFDTEHKARLSEDAMSFNKTVKRAAGMHSHRLCGRLGSTPWT